MARTAKKAAKTFKFNASDVLGALALEAERISGAAKLFAHGANFPDPELISGTIKRMNELNEILIANKNQPGQTEPNTSIN